MRGPLSLVALSVGMLAVTACQPTMMLTSAELPQASTAQIHLGNKVTDNAPIDQPIVLFADDGRFTEVTVTNGPSRVIDGEFSDDGRTWTSSRNFLDYDSKYKIAATVVDARGMTVTFDEPVKDRAAVEEGMVVRTSTPIEGAWYWTGPTEAIYRPKEYWPGNTEIQLDLSLRGIEASPGQFGDGNSMYTYTTPDSVVMKADAETLMMKVFVNGKKERTIPVTMGMDGYETLSGTKLIMSKERTRIMDNATAGVDKNDPEHYRVKVDYAMRLTWHGEFLHASPWAAGAWGNYRYSHGCTSMSTENAGWLYEISHIGDPVELTGTSLKQNPGNGITVWNISWTDWTADSGLGGVMTSPLV